MDTANTPCFSPTQTKAFIEDQTAWYLRYVMKRVPKTISKMELAGFLGTAFADGAAVLHNSLLASPSMERPSESLIKEAAKVAVQSIKESKEEVLALGQSVWEKETEYWDLLDFRATEAVFKYGLNFPAVLRDIVASEMTLPYSGRCRIDLVVNSPLGPMVVDFKTKLTLDVKYQGMVLREYETDWQMLHYLWAYQRHLRDMGDTAATVRRFAVCLHVLEPKSRLPLVHSVLIDSPLMAIWEQSARKYWAEMQAIRDGRSQPACSFMFFDKFGRKKWADAISKCYLDEFLLDTYYIKEEKRAEAF